jgi:hypothetical protein
MEKLLLGLIIPANNIDSWSSEYYIKNEREPRYQILSLPNEGNLEEYLDVYLDNVTEILEGSYFFFVSIPTDTEYIRVIDNINYKIFKASDEKNKEIEIKSGNGGIIRN